MNKNNHDNPKADYLAQLTAMSDEQLGKECESKIWLSAYATNNPRSKYHWQCDATYDECQQRGKPQIYSAAHKRASRK